MFVFTWVGLLFTVEAATAKTFSENGYSVTLSDREIRAEAGLCVVIPCYSTSYQDLQIWSVAWSKCQRSKSTCSDSDVIFNSASPRLYAGFRGRLSLLSKLPNCSIIINDVTESDSGSYQLTINHFSTKYQKLNEHTFSTRANVTVRALTQKPTLTVPALAEGRPAELLCMAPGLCSGSRPNIEWLWQGGGGGREKGESNITGSIVVFSTETLTAVSQQHSSSLTFRPTAAVHHGSRLSCRVSFLGGVHTEETVTLRVPYSPKVLFSKCESQLDVLICTCTSEGFPPPTIKWSLVESHDEYSVTSGVSGCTVNSTIILTATGDVGPVYCLSRNEAGKEQKQIIVTVAPATTAGIVPEGATQSVVLPWVIAAVSLLVAAISIIYVLIQRRKRSRRRQNPSAEDRTYMSLKKKSEPSTDYDVIGSRQK